MTPWRSPHATPMALQAAVGRSEPAPDAPDVETSSAAYAARFAGRAGAWMLDVQERVILRMLQSWQTAAILEVGGGHGQITGALAGRGHDVTVLGSDPRCQERIRSLVEQGRCRFVTGPLLALPYPDRAFDIVISLRLLPHVEAWPWLVAELARVARDAVLVDYPTARSLNCLTPALFGAKRRVEGNTRPYRLFREADVVEAFAAHGFTRRARCAQFFWPMVLHRLVGRPGISRALEGPGRLSGLTAWLGSPVLALWTREGL